MYTTNTLSADGSVQIASCHSRRGVLEYIATILVNGTWGGGTITFSFSKNGGTTKIPVKDLTGTTVTSTADDNVNISTGTSHINTVELTLWATLAGATNPSLTLDVFDNR